MEEAEADDLARTGKAAVELAAAVLVVALEAALLAGVPQLGGCIFVARATK